MIRGLAVSLSVRKCFLDSFALVKGQRVSSLANVRIVLLKVTTSKETDKQRLITRNEGLIDLNSSHTLANDTFRTVEQGHATPGPFCTCS